MDKVDASEHACIVCKKEQATTFWPTNIEGIEPLPYCDHCLEQEEAMMKILVKEFEFQQNIKKIKDDNRGKKDGK